MSKFQPGFDSRRNTAGGKGRAPSSRSISAKIRSTLGRDADAILEQVQTLARAGDAEAITAAAFLLGSALRTQ